MTEPLDMFAPATDNPHVAPPAPMTAEQRGQIRDLFAILGVSTAHEQFRLVDVLVGVRLRSVGELTSKSAAILIPRIRERVESHSRSQTGNSWTDREEDTWIDKL